jgi:hypothetical protein
MPRLSLYRPEKTNDYKFLDRTIKEMFVVGATDLYVHKYLGVQNTGPSNDFTQPQYDQLDPTNIQDLLFLENRDRKYETSIYRIRGHYNVQNLDFDLSQFGLFLNNDIIFITVHYNEMIELIGRKLMVGDVFELPHLTDYHPLNEAIPVGLRRYYQITDANFASEGFSQTWYPHLWRIKCEPLVDSQEFANILSEPISQDNYLGDWDSTKSYPTGYTVTYGDKIYTPKSPGPVPPGIAPTDPAYWELSTADNLRDILGRYNKNIEVNDAAIAEAARIVPKTGYDRQQLYVVPTFDGEPSPPVNILVPAGAPIPNYGTLEFVSSAGYRNPSPVLRIGAEARKKLQTLTGKDADALREFISVTLKTGKLAPERLDTGSGQVDGTLVLTAKANGAITGPYGTADNTYSTADQFPPFTLTSLEVPIGSTTISVQPMDVTQDIAPKNLISAFVTSENGTQINIFADNTRIVSVNKLLNTFTIDQPTITLMPAGTAIQVEPDFDIYRNPISQTMDYRADCDPRFQFIARTTPQGYGYTNGYMIGDGTAPNGLPVGSGITFPANPTVGDYFLRIDYLPNLLYRWDGSLWIRIGVSSRAGVAFDSTIPSEQNQLASFINNEQTLVLTDGTVIPQQQPLSSILTIQPD